MDVYGEKRNSDGFEPPSKRLHEEFSPGISTAVDQTPLDVGYNEHATEFCPDMSTGVDQAPLDIGYNPECYGGPTPLACGSGTATDHYPDLRNNGNYPAPDVQQLPPDGTINREMNVPRGFIGRIIGRAGANLRDMQDRYQVQLKFEPPPQEVDCSSNCQIIFSGLQHNVDAAIDAVQGSLRDHTRFSVGPGEIYEKMEVVPSMIGALIGTKGTTVQRIRDESGSRVRVDRSDQGPNFVHIYGFPQNVEHAQRMIGAIINDPNRISAARPFLSGSVKGRIQIPHRCVGILIGKGGECIKDISQRTECQIRIHDVVEPPEPMRLISITGSHDGVVSCIDICMEKLRGEGEVLQYPGQMSKEMQTELQGVLASYNEYLAQANSLQNRNIAAAYAQQTSSHTNYTHLVQSLLYAQQNVQDTTAIEVALHNEYTKYQTAQQVLQQLSANPNAMVDLGDGKGTRPPANGSQQYQRQMQGNQQAMLASLLAQYQAQQNGSVQESQVQAVNPLKNIVNPAVTSSAPANTPAPATISASTNTAGGTTPKVDVVAAVSQMSTEKLALLYAEYQRQMIK